MGPLTHSSFHSLYCLLQSRLTHTNICGSQENSPHNSPLLPRRIPPSQIQQFKPKRQRGEERVLTSPHTSVGHRIYGARDTAICDESVTVITFHFIIPNQYPIAIQFTPVSPQWIYPLSTFWQSRFHWFYHLKLKLRTI